MTINRDNFESFLLDYLEGNLDPLLTADLMAFFAENPGFECLKDEFNQEMVLKSTGSFENKNALKKDFPDLPAVTSANFEEFCIASAENMLDEADEKRLADYIAENPEKKADFEIYRKLKLQPDTAVVFPHKAALKKTIPFNRPVKRRFLYYATGLAAAVLALLLMLTVNKKPAAVHTVADIQKHQNMPAGVRPDHAQTAAAVNNLKDQPVLVNKGPHKIRKNNTITQEQPVPVPENPVMATVAPLPVEPLHPAKPAPDMAELLAFHQKNNYTPVPSTNSTSIKPESTSEGFIGTLLAKVDFWETAEIAVQGFNALTESRLSIGKETDTRGNVKGLQVDTESYALRITK